MATLNLEGIGRVQVDDSFRSLPSDQQENTINEIVSQLQGNQQAAKPRGPLGVVDDVVRKLASGATFGWADELAARGDAMLGRGTYEENMKREAARDAQISPWIGVPAEIVGGVASAIAAGPLTGAAAAASGLSRLPQIIRHAGIGGAAGAAYGAGSAEEGSRASGALTGAAVGAPLGVAAPYALQGAVRAGQAVRGAFSPQSQVAADLGRAITRDNMTPEQLAARAATLTQQRPGVATLADAGGENVRGLVERVAQTPGAGRTTVVPALTQRQQGQMNRMAVDLRHLTGTHRAARETIDETMAQRAQSARPLYQQAYEEGDRQIWTPGLERLTGSPSFVRAMHGAVRAWRDQSIADGFGAMNPGALVQNGVLRFQGGNVPVFPNLQFWDYTKRFLDDQVRTAMRAGQNSKAQALTRITQQLRTELDQAAPETYRAARDAWAGPSRYLEALEEGRNILNTRISGDDLHAAMRNMADSDREAYRVGAISAIIGKMGSDPAKLGDMTKYLRSPEMRSKIAAIMPTEEAYQNWVRRLEFEISASELTGRALGNSATARRLAERRDADSIAGDLVLDALSGSPVFTLWQRLVRNTAGRARDTLRSRSDARLADTLMNPQSPQQLEAVLRRAQRSSAPLSETARGASAVGANALWNYGNSP